jgi:hypothetical protein
MGKVRILFCFVLGLNFCCFAKQVSFQVIQHDPATTDVTEQTLKFEDELLNSLFENGFIVTNSPSVSSESDEQDSTLFNSALGDALDGFSDLFVQMKVYYFPRTGTLTDNAEIERIEWSLSNAKNGEKIAGKKIGNIRKINKSNDTILVADEVISEIISAIKA